MSPYWGKFVYLAPLGESVVAGLSVASVTHPASFRHWHSAQGQVGPFPFPWPSCPDLGEWLPVLSSGICCYWQWGLSPLIAGASVQAFVFGVDLTACCLSAVSVSLSSWGFLYSERDDCTAASPSLALCPEDDYTCGVVWPRLPADLPHPFPSAQARLDLSSLPSMVAGTKQLPSITLHLA